MNPLLFGILHFITITQIFCCNFKMSSKQAQVLCQRPVRLRVLPSVLAVPGVLSAWNLQVLGL